MVSGEVTFIRIFAGDRPYRQIPELDLRGHFEAREKQGKGNEEEGKEQEGKGSS